MPPQPPAKRTVPLGELKPRTDAELEALSAVGPDDLIAAGELWQRAAPKPLKELLNAEPDEPDA